VKEAESGVDTAECARAEAEEEEEEQTVGGCELCLTGTGEETWFSFVVICTDLGRVGAERECCDVREIGVGAADVVAAVAMISVSGTFVPPKGIGKGGHTRARSPSGFPSEISA